MTGWDGFLTDQIKDDYERGYAGGRIAASVEIESLQIRVEELERIIWAILDADERGQGQPFADAMERAFQATRGRVEAVEIGRSGYLARDFQGINHERPLQNACKTAPDATDQAHGNVDEKP